MKLIGSLEESELLNFSLSVLENQNWLGITSAHNTAKMIRKINTPAMCDHTLTDSLWQMQRLFTMLLHA